MRGGCLAGWLAFGFSFSAADADASSPRDRGLPFVVATNVFVHVAVFEDDRAGHDIVQKRAVVADHQQRAGKFNQLLFQQLQRFAVQIIGRFVQHDHVGRPRHQLRQQCAIAFAAGEKSNFRAGSLGREQESPASTPECVWSCHRS